MRYLCALLLFASTLCFGGESLKLAVASNFKPTLQALEPLWHEQYDTPWIISSGPSGALTQQILHGAPFDVFLSADEKFPAQIYQASIGHPPTLYVRGQLILACRFAAQGVNEALLKAHTLALANTRTAPYGIAAAQWLESAAPATRARQVQAGSVAGALQYAVTGNADCALVAASFSQLAPELHWYTLPEPVTLNQAGMQLSDKPAAAALLEFLATPKARAVIVRHGYLAVE